MIYWPCGQYIGGQNIISHPHLNKATCIAYQAKIFWKCWKLVILQLAFGRHGTGNLEWHHMKSRRNRHGNTFNITGPLWGEFDSDLWIPHTKGQWYRALVFSSVVNLNSLLRKQLSCWWFETPWHSFYLTLMKTKLIITGGLRPHPFQKPYDDVYICSYTSSSHQAHDLCKTMVLSTRVPCFLSLNPKWGECLLLGLIQYTNIPVSTCCKHSNPQFYCSLD